MARGNVMAFRKKNKKMCEIPFNSTNKFQVHTIQTCFVSILGFSIIAYLCICAVLCVYCTVL